MANSISKIVLFSSTGEPAWGSTAGSPDRKFHGLTDASLTINSQVEVTESVGWIGPSALASELAQSGEGAIEGTLCYDEAPTLLNGLFAAAAPAFTYDYSAPVASTQACYTYSIEFGTSGYCYTARGAIINGLTLKGEAGQSWRFSAPLLAKQVVGTTMTTSANIDRSVDLIRMGDTVLSIDPFSTGTFGGTPVSASLINFDLTIAANRHMKHFGGSKFPGDWGDGRMTGSLAMTLEFNSTAKAYIDAMLGSTGDELQRHIRLQATQNSTQQQFTLDFAGIQSEPVKMWDDRDGNQIVNLKFAGKHSTGLSGGNWLTCQVVDQSYWGLPAVPAPTLGSELITNGTMEADANWGNLNTPTTNERSTEQVYAGTYSRKVVGDPSDGISGSANPFTTATGTWYQLSYYAYSVGATSILHYWRKGDDSGFQAIATPTVTQGAWTNVVRTLRETAGGAGAYYMNAVGTGGIDTYYTDNVSVKPLTLASLFTLACDPGLQAIKTSTRPTLTAGTQCGHAFCIDDTTAPTYFLLAYHDGTTAYLDKCEAGTYTSLIATAATYVAGAELRLEKSGNSVDLYYNGSQVSTTQTVDTSAGYGTEVATFSTYASNTPGTVGVYV